MRSRDRATSALSVIVRTYNSSQTVMSTLKSLREQDVPLEIVVVDSGSTDGTVALAAPMADQLVTLPHDRFTYGRALNMGARAATAPHHAALSSHCVLPRSDWARLALGHLERGAAAVVGLPRDGLNRSLDRPLSVDNAYLRQYPMWGMTNHASAWAGSVWLAEPFDEHLEACEDKEWSWRAVTGQHFMVVDPALVVTGDHRRAHGVGAYWRRLNKEVGALAALDAVPRLSAGDALVDWARPHPRSPFATQSRRLGRTRALELGAHWINAR